MKVNPTNGTPHQGPEISNNPEKGPRYPPRRLGRTKGVAEPCRGQKAPKNGPASRPRELNILGPGAIIKEQKPEGAGGPDPSLPVNPPQPLQPAGALGVAVFLAKAPKQKQSAPPDGPTRAPPAPPPPLPNPGRERNRRFKLPPKTKPRTPIQARGPPEMGGPKKDNPFKGSSTERRAGKRPSLCSPGGVEGTAGVAPRV